MRRLGWTCALALAALATACSALVGGDPDGPIACERVGSADPCAELGMVCGPSGFCQSGECLQRDICGNGIDDDCNGTVDDGSAEACNGEDDDCDGRVDEELDEDGDGSSWCPLTEGPVDCDDTDAEVYPGRPDDPCDGADSDCDSSTPDGTNCTGDQVCTPRSCTIEGCTPDDRCQDIDCVNRPSLCAADQFCDRDADPPTCRPLVEDCRMDAFRCSEPERCNPETGECVLARPNGSSCTYDAECQSNLCFPAEALRLRPEHVDGRNGICTRSCCDDADCDDGEICWEPGSGARGCVPEQILSMGSNGVPSVDTCLGDDACGAEYCRPVRDDAYVLTGRTSLTCRPPASSPDGCRNDFECDLLLGEFCAGGTCRNSLCFGGSDCPTGMCADDRCRDSCRTASDCPGSDGSCVYVGLRTEGRVDVFPVCYYADGGAGNGVSCSSNSECRDRTCVGPDGTEASEPKRCAATCCLDTHCGDTGQCRPLFLGSWEMHCMERPRFDTGGGSP
jgi:hypothetical protein